MSETEEKLVNLEVNGEPVQARPGQMIIEVTDAAGVYRICLNTFSDIESPVEYSFQMQPTGDDDHGDIPGTGTQRHHRRHHRYR